MFVGGRASSSLITCMRHAGLYTCCEVSTDRSRTRYCAMLTLLFVQVLGHNGGTDEAGKKSRGTVKRLSRIAPLPVDYCNS
jgi:hypothetical protein